MNLKALLTTPVPPHSFLVDPERLVYAGLVRRRNAIQRVETVPMGEGWCRLGPVGILQVDRPTVAAALAALGRRLGKPPARASLVVPNDWVRSVLVDADGLPRQRQEAEDVVRWRLKRLLPCRPEEVRLDYSPTGDGERALVILALDRPLAALEEEFGAAGTSLGRIEPMALALTSLLPRGDGLRLLVMLEPRAVGLVLVGRGGEPLLVRHKLLLGNVSQNEAFLIRELSRTSSHVRAQAAVDSSIEVLLLGSEAELAETVANWAEQERGVTVRRLALEGGPWPVTPGLSPVQMAALLATAAGGEG
jgi:hypothetical protein